MDVKILENFFFMGKLYKMGTVANIDKAYFEMLDNKIEPIEINYIYNTKKELKDILKSKNIECAKKATKEEMIELLGGE